MRFNYCLKVHNVHRQVRNAQIWIGYQFKFGTRIHSSGMRTDRSLLYRGVSVQGVSLSRGCLCPGGSLSRGSLSRGVSVQGGLCPGGSLSRGVSVQGGLCPGGSLSKGGLCQGRVSVQGISVQGVSVRETPPVNRMTHRSKDITFQQLCLQTVINWIWFAEQFNTPYNGRY